MANALINFETNITQGFTMLVNDKIRDEMENGTFGLSGQASSLLDLSNLITEYFESNYWFIQQIPVNGSRAENIAHIQGLFPNAYVNAPAQYNIAGFNIIADNSDPYQAAVGLDRWATSIDFSLFFTLLSHSSTKRDNVIQGSYSVGFVVLRGSEVDFTNKVLQIDLNSNAPVWVEIIFNSDTWEYSLTYALAGSNVDLAHLLQRMPGMATAPFISYIGDTDPYEPGGDTGDDDTDGTGGTGDFDGTTDPIDFPDLPTVSAVDTKFITIFNPSKAQLTSLAEYMWSPLFDIDTLKKLWADPMDCILGLTMVPFAVPNGGTGTVAIGNVSTGISMTKAGSQYVSVDCGSINVKEFWGGYLDYDPYTKFQIYLPYVGIKPLLADEIMGKSIHVRYHCDILTGACNCFVKCDGSVLYSFNGQCSTQIPISGNDWRNTISAAVNIAGQAAGMYMTGGATAPMAITSIAQSAVNALKPQVEKSGSLSGTGGMLAIQKPYLIATRPQQAVPKNQNKFTGYPAFITRTLSSCKGYTEIYSCHLENIPCTADELNEIENLLKSGVIL